MSLVIGLIISLLGIWMMSFNGQDSLGLIIAVIGGVVIMVGRRQNSTKP